MITTLAALHERIATLQGHTIGSLAHTLGLTSPEDLQHHKGWLGQVLELALGTDAGSQSKPDFTQLGIELKTIPVTAAYQPLESTYVCTVPLQSLSTLTFENSSVHAKLSHVLWIPILTLPQSRIADRPLLTPVLWQPNETQSHILKTDFDEIMDLIAVGQLAQITASLGVALHVRPKAANAKVLTSAFDEEGHASSTLPRGFYLRPSFTAEILRTQLSD